MDVPLNLWYSGMHGAADRSKLYALIGIILCQFVLVATNRQVEILSGGAKVPVRKTSSEKRAHHPSLHMTP